jgi:2-dehydro-3-deoxygluconokinase
VAGPGRERAAERLAKLSNASDIVFVGLDEAQLLWQLDTAEDVREILHGAGTLVVKDGATRAVSFGGTMTSVSALRVDVVESVGAGDAFAAGWLAAFLKGREPSAALRFGHLLARAALTSLSDQGGALSLATIAQLAGDETLWAARDDTSISSE